MSPQPSKKKRKQNNLWLDGTGFTSTRVLVHRTGESLDSFLPLTFYDSILLFIRQNSDSTAQDYVLQRACDHEE